jgi:16S rRNA (uracil1498-N3)-methyltransferase
MRKIFVPSSAIIDGKITVSDREKAHHIRDVLRLSVDDEIAVCDDKGNQFLAAIAAVAPRLILKLKKKMPASVSENKIMLTVACALPKRSTIDDIIEKLTQVGVERVIPMTTERVVVSFDEEKKQVRLARWRTIALNASEQSQRSSLPAIEPVTDFKTLLASSGDYDLKLLFTLPGTRTSLKKVLQQIRSKNILILIGPEGDFTDEEIEAAKKAGCIAVSLGDLVLRVETAAVAAASFIMLYENG